MNLTWEHSKLIYYDIFVSTIKSWQWDNLEKNMYYAK